MAKSTEDTAPASGAVSDTSEGIVEAAGLRAIAFCLAGELLRDARGRRTLAELEAAAEAISAFFTRKDYPPAALLDAMRTGVAFSAGALMTIGEAIGVAQAQLNFAAKTPPAVVPENHEAGGLL